MIDLRFCNKVIVVYGHGDFYLDKVKPRLSGKLCGKNNADNENRG